MTVKAASKTRTKPAAERRDELMQAAERLFLERGFEQTAIEQITTLAGVAKGTFYLHFSSKMDVVEALRQRFVTALLERIDVETSRSDRDWVARLGSWAKACAAGYLDTDRLHHLVFVAVPPSTQEGLTRNGLIDSLQDLLASGDEAGAWTVSDPRFSSVFLFSALHGIVQQPVADRLDRHQLLSAIETHFLRHVFLPSRTD